MKLVIAEKPSLGRTIASAIPGQHFVRKDGYLESSQYIVSWCFGHLYELLELDKYFPDYKAGEKAKWDMNRLPFYPEDWKFKYEPRLDKDGKSDGGVKEQIKILRELMNRKDVDVIYHAGDADQEGQAIVDHVLNFNLKSRKTVLRLWLPALTPEAIREAFQTAKPNDEYQNLYQAATARGAEDWLLGIELTRYASLKTHSFVRIGRCVCVIAEHVVERERAIQNFVPVPYTAIFSDEKTNGEKIELTSKKTFEKGHEKEAQALADKYNASGAVVTDIQTKRTKVFAPKLFSQTDLQSYVCKQDKSLSPSDVLAAAQSLYEGGYLTYPRTNTNYLSQSEISKVDDVLAAFAKNGITGLENKPKSKSVYDDSKIESHSAIIPTTKIPSALNGAEKTVYDTVANRFCAVFCKEPCFVDKTSMTIRCSDEDFVLHGEVEVQTGWRRFEKGKNDKILPKLKKGDAVNILFRPIGKETTPPRRYTVEALNNWMKAPMRDTKSDPDAEYSDAEWQDILQDATICTEATRADTIDRCIKSGYISLKKGVYYGEPAGFYMVDVIHGLKIDLDVETTVQMSRDLHKVRVGEMRRVDVLDSVKDKIDSIFDAQGTVQSEYTPKMTGGREALCKCPRCGSDIIETQKSFVCTGKCGVGLWKDSALLDSIGKRMTKNVAKLLFTDGKVKLTGCVSKKTGKKFDCNLVLDLSGDKPSMSLSFDEGNVVGKCPICGGEVREWSQGYSCVNKDFSLFKKTKRFNDIISITPPKAKALLSGGKIPAKLTSQKGKQYEAYLRLDGVREYNGKYYPNLIQDGFVNRGNPKNEKIKNV